MEKIPTVFRRDHDTRKVIAEVNPECGWVVMGEGMATRKFDGTCTMLDNDGGWWARREVKAGKTPPDNWNWVNSDPFTGKRVGWEPIAQSSFYGAFLDVPASLMPVRPGTYELIGKKINGDPEHIFAQDKNHPHRLVKHGTTLLPHTPHDYTGLAEMMSNFPYEGIVWHHMDGRMAKLKRRDFPTPTKEI